jgi:hypothetical protein
MPSTVATVPRLAKPANPASPSMKHRLHAQMVTEFMGEIKLRCGMTHEYLPILKEL